MTTSDKRARARALSQEYAARGDHLGWFEALYREARAGGSMVPWADFTPNPNLIDWHRLTQYDFTNKPCLTVGCGLGDDAQYLAGAGGDVTAFDISPTATAWCRSLYPESRVEYVTADVLALPLEWSQRFDFIFEANTLQVLPPDMRQDALASLARVLAPRGSLLVICRARDAEEPPGEVPWPLTREELRHAAGFGLEEASFEDFYDRENPPVRRFRVEYRRTS